MGCHCEFICETMKAWLRALNSRCGCRLTDISRLVEEHEQTLLEAWHDYFDT